MSDLSFSGDGGGGGGFDWVQLAVNLAALSEDADAPQRERGRLSGLQLLTARPGQPITRLFGRMRIGGQIIWRGAVREHISETGGDGGDKGGGSETAREKHYRYTMHVAIGLCEGPISRIGRIWADGQLLDSTALDYQLYRGEENAQPDPLIKAARGADATPAFRGLAYIMLRDFDLSTFGNRVPQFSFEVFRPVGDDAIKPKAMCLLPGANEFAYHPEPHIRYLGPGRAVGENLSSQASRSDWDISLDHLQEVHEQCRAAALVVSWFGTDLRADKCRLLPKVDNKIKQTLPHGWSVADLSRDAAEQVSLVDGRPSFGGTPSDHAVIAAIKDLDQRGLKVTFCPFIMMDIAADNNLPDPYGAMQQAAYPWRGRITADRPPEQHGKPLSKRALKAIFDNFFDGHRLYALRGMILHYARLCAEAGGVEAFLIGSELRELSRLCDRQGRYEFANRLKLLAAEVRAILPDAKISYAADWSEYGAHVSASQHIGFPLDNFWGDENCDFIGIDNYLPLADWRDGPDHEDAKKTAEIYRQDYLQNNIRGGEYFDWYYKSQADRKAQKRTNISGEAAWRFRAKDIQGWWEHEHRPQRNGMRKAATPWRPKSKPIWFTELGCPAIDKGANQPNVFPDTRSSEGGRPHFSDGTRDDAMQRAFLNAVQRFYETPQQNPYGTYGAPMVDAGRIFYWAWDARPYPAFPFRLDLWSDGGNWHNGHWLNGRDASAPLAALMSAIAAPLRPQAENLIGQVEGYALRATAPPHQELLPLLTAFGVDGLVGTSRLRLRGRRNRPVIDVAADDILLGGEGRSSLTRILAAPDKVLNRFDLFFLDADGDYGSSHVSARFDGGDRPVARLDVPVAMGQKQARGLARYLLHAARGETETISMRLPPSYLALEPGDIIRFDNVHWQITEVTLGDVVELTARRFQAHLFSGALAEDGDDTNRAGDTGFTTVGHIARPELRVIDLPQPARRFMRSSSNAPLLAAFAAPWPQAVRLHQSAAPPVLLDAPSIIGETLSTLAAGPVGRWDRGSGFELELYGGSLAALPESEVLAGGNRLAVETAIGWEVIQFANAELIGERRYRLSDLLRGQFGSDDAQVAQLAAGAACILLGAAQQPMAAQLGQLPSSMQIHYGPPNLPTDSYGWQTINYRLQRRALMCLSPVHAKISWPQGVNADWEITWTRRSRIDGDDFDAPDIMLGEARQAYALALMGDAKGQEETITDWMETTPRTKLSKEFRATHSVAFDGSQKCRLRIAQLNDRNQAGAPLYLTLTHAKRN